MKTYDVIVIGAGASGLMAAANAVERGRRVAILEKGQQPARKVMASGGGRCNFTNMAAERNRYFGQNPDFVRGALSRFGPQDMLDWAKKHNITPIEKAQGQLFCAEGAEHVVKALLQTASGAELFTQCMVNNLAKEKNEFVLTTERGDFKAQSVIIATGGTSFASLGVSDIGIRIAKKFGHKIIPVRPALCAIGTSKFGADLAGISVPVEIIIGKNSVRDSMLFTHFGIGGPAAYRATLYDLSGGIKINLMPDKDALEILRAAKQVSGRKTIAGILSEHIPMRVAQWVAQQDTRRVADIKDTDLAYVAQRITQIEIDAASISLHGMQSAEVVRGGVDTAQISSKTMESKLCAGLFFAGEVIDVAGDLGGFNLQWAWASGHVAGQNA